MGAAATAPCPLYDLELIRVSKTPEVQKISDGFKDMFDYATEHSGMEINNFVNAIKLLDTLIVEVSGNCNNIFYLYINLTSFINSIYRV